MRGLRLHTGIFASFIVVALIATWPLATHLGTHVTGQVSGDTGVYVWNQWVFQHELLDHGRWPFYTDAIFPLRGGINLALHNYTVFANLLALPLITPLGVVVTFNLVYLFLVALTGWAMFVLARQVGLLPLEAWLAGVLFTCSPVLIARGTSHFSLVAAAPLPLLIVAFLRFKDTGAWRWAVTAGATSAWAAYCDVYFGIFAPLMLATLWVVFKIRADRPVAMPPPRWRRRLGGTLSVLIAVVSALVVLQILTGGGEFQVGGLRVVSKTLYTPMLVLTVLVALRIALAWLPRLQRHGRIPLRRWLRAGVVASGIMALLLAPALYAFAQHLLADPQVNPPVHWRSSPPGIDLAAILLPNPNHALIGQGTLAWLTSVRGDALPEFTASIPWVVLALVASAWWRGGPKWPGAWAGFTLLFLWLATGPFLHVARVNTFIPGPWAVLRYVPVVGFVRSPARFFIVAMIGVALMAGFALAALRARRSARSGRSDLGSARPGLVYGVAVAVMLFELAPMPRPLYSAAVPAIFDLVKADPDQHNRVLPLPTGLRDGTVSVGGYSAAQQYYQAYHGHDIVGGYVSRVPPSVQRFYADRRLLAAFGTLSAGQALSRTEIEAVRSHGPLLVRDGRIRWVAADTTRTSPDLLAFAIEVLDLELVREDPGWALYRPRIAPAVHTTPRGR